jgi:hypothetical protein
MASYGFEILIMIELVTSPNGNKKVYCSFLALVIQAGRVDMFSPLYNFFNSLSLRPVIVSIEGLGITKHFIVNSQPMCPPPQLQEMIFNLIYEVSRFNRP